MNRLAKVDSAGETHFLWTFVFWKNNSRFFNFYISLSLKRKMRSKIREIRVYYLTYYILD